MAEGGVRVGIDLPGDPRPDSLRESLRFFTEQGYDCIEIDLGMLPLIIGGEVRGEYVEWLGALMKEFPVAYSAHSIAGLDLRPARGHELQRAVLGSSIEVCARLGMSPLVLHYECASRDFAEEERFLDAHRWAADIAAKKGVLLCVENIEVEHMDPVIRFVESVGHSNLRMTIDVGHAFLAARYFHYDFLESIRAAMPLAGHMHLSDNTGDFEELRITNRPVYDAMGKGYRFALGRGDIHVPPLWGRIPYADVFHAARDFRGIFICEYYSEYFLPFVGETQRRVRAGILAAR
jgi:sugar phosphate isomerase/epimerase